jgi:hypothetical protein
MAVDIDGVNSTISTDKLIPQSGTALQIGESGDTVTLVGTAVNFGGGVVAQIVTEAHTAYLSATTRVYDDDTIPQNTEGTEIITRTITPTSATNHLFFTFSGNLNNSSTQYGFFALFQDTTADALALGWSMIHMGNHSNHLSFTHDMVAGTTSSTTFKIRMGTSSASPTYRTNGSNTARRFGGISANRLTIIEYTP